jgi:hypothetical protein
MASLPATPPLPEKGDELPAADPPLLVGAGAIAEGAGVTPEVPAPLMFEAPEAERANAAAAHETVTPTIVPTPDSLSTPEPTAPLPTPRFEIRDVHDLDWAAIREVVEPLDVRARMRNTVEGLEALLDQADGPGMLFDNDRADAADRAIRVGQETLGSVPMWVIGDLHGDLLALESALTLIAAKVREGEGTQQRIVFLGDFFDDEGCGLEVLLRVYELILAAPERVCIVAGNHDEALSYDGVRFGSSVSPCDFSDLLNANLAHEWIERAGKLAVRLFARAPRALFFPSGLLVSHGGFPLSDLHDRLIETANWNDPTCLSDFVWTRAHPKARRKIPNRFTRGSQFGYEDFAAFCELSTRLGRPVTHMIRGHDHVEDRYAVYPAYQAHPVLTTVALSRRLPRETFGPRERVPTLVRVLEGATVQVHRMHIPNDLIHDVYPEPSSVNGPNAPAAEVPS